MKEEGEGYSGKLSDDVLTDNGTDGPDCLSILRKASRISAGVNMPK